VCNISVKIYSRTYIIQSLGIIRLRHYMKVHGHLNSFHAENRILHVSVIILNEVCVIYDRII
jgi:hypothetical protein